MRNSSGELERECEATRNKVISIGKEIEAKNASIAIHRGHLDKCTKATLSLEKRLQNLNNEIAVIKKDTLRLCAEDDKTRRVLNEEQ